MVDFRDPLQRPRSFIQGLKSKPWWDVADVPAAARFEHTYPEIRKEFSNLLLCGRLSLHPEQHDFAEGNWSIFSLWSFGELNRGNSLEAPRTTKVIQDISDITSVPNGVTYFSVMGPNTHVVPHCGPTTEKLRFHLGLRVPDGATMRVGKETRRWEEGRCIVFDDSFEHEVFNRSDQIRAVLLVDVWHPNLPTHRRDFIRRTQRKRNPQAENRTGVQPPKSDSSTINVSASTAESYCILHALESNHLASLLATASKLAETGESFIGPAAQFVLAAAKNAPDPSLLAAEGTLVASMPWQSIATLLDRTHSSSSVEEIGNIVHIASMYWRTHNANRTSMLDFFSKWTADEKAAVLKELLSCGDPVRAIRALAESSSKIPFGALSPLMVAAFT